MLVYHQHTVIGMNTFFQSVRYILKHATLNMLKNNVNSEKVLRCIHLNHTSIPIPSVLF